MPTTIIRFNGLLVFRHDPQKKRFEVGVLRARAQPHSHILQIEGTFTSASGNGTLPVPTSDELESYVQHRHVQWNLDVELNGQPVEGLDFNPAEPRDRLDPRPNDAFGWVINIEGARFHGRRLQRVANGLQPVIFLKKGKLITGCKTDSVDTIKGGEPGTTSELGFIAGAIDLTIDTSRGEEAVLRFPDSGGTKEIFRCVETRQRDYVVSIMNTPPPGSTIGSGHFHLFYDRLFQGVASPDRFDISIHQRPHSPDDRCPEGKKEAPDPFKCGGIRIEDTSGPLG